MSKLKTRRIGNITISPMVTPENCETKAERKVVISIYDGDGVEQEEQLTLRQTSALIKVLIDTRDALLD